MSEEEKVNPVLKPTNKRFKLIDGWLVEVEESAMKLKITHKSNHYQLRVFAAEQANAILDNWSKENPELIGFIFDSVKVLSEHAMMNPELLVRLNTTFATWMLESQKEFTDEEHDAALEEVKKEFKEKEKLKAQLMPEVLEDIELNKQN